MLYRLAYLISLGIEIYCFIIFARVVFSWLPAHTRQNPVYEIIYRMTEPVLRPVRRRLPPMQGIDLSPIVVIVVLYALRYVLFGT